MAKDANSRAAPPAGQLLAGLDRGWTLLVDGLAALGTLMIGVLMAIICADVVARNLMGASLPLVSELGALTLVMIVYLQLATTVRHDRLARTELFFTGFRERLPRAGAVLACLFDLTGAVALAAIAWSTVGIIERDLSSGQFIGVTGVMTLPTWPFRALIILGMSVSAVQFLVMAAKNLRAAARGKGART
ncbi:TRAP transporter small permease subunit [Polymorphum gilvum]|uniref:TRAP transporter small permease protein n=1 Tax=Polymorphum gilvum (strain LMG 25793 / CGMCC 1.9160 / SL003B-26A1) TaxID=991905 RepID=F2J2I5_POLGS|nr:TRAP transporter small permease [Polymorphum gilvum]ADZ70899.1 hypothetical protein SL003B_2475 [Polymorphum gilvum SL003B-26A1]